MYYLIHLLILIGIYSILAISLNLLIRYTGILSFMHASFWGIGAYISAILSSKYNISFEINLVVVSTICGLFGLLIGNLVLKIYDDYLAICTVAIQIVFFSLINNCIKITNGPFGITDIPHLSVLGINLGSDGRFLIFTLIMTLIIMGLTRNIDGAPLGRLLCAIKNDEIFTQSLGKNVMLVKKKIFILSGIIAGIAGILYAQYLNYIDPSSFTLEESIFLVMIVIMGGKNRTFGPILGAAFWVLIPEIFRQIGLPVDIGAHLRKILLGTIIILLLMTKPLSFGGLNR